MAVDLARFSAHSHQVASLATAGNDRMHQIMAQVVNQPGLEDVFADLLEYEDRTGEELGAELYMEHCPPHLEGEMRCCLCAAFSGQRMSFASTSLGFGST
jgi:hypothetical protein